jgi:hypothetical protein
VLVTQKQQDSSRLKRLWRIPIGSTFIQFVLISALAFHESPKSASREQKAHIGNQQAKLAYRRTTFNTLILAAIATCSCSTSCNVA